MTKMGVKEFRDNFTTIVREATGPVIITNHGKVVGWFTPAPRPTPETIQEMLDAWGEVRAALIARGVDVDARLRELGIDDDAPEASTPEGKPRRR